MTQDNIRYIIVMCYPSHLAEFGEHDDDGGVVFPQHSPEVLCGLRQRALRGHVGFLLPASGTKTPLGLIHFISTLSLFNHKALVIVKNYSHQSSVIINTYKQLE